MNSPMKKTRFLAREAFQSLLDELTHAGFGIIGPQVRDHAIVYAPLTHTEQLPVGITDVQAPGHYRLKDKQTDYFFSWANGPQALKTITFPGREPLWHSQCDENGHLQFEEQAVESTPIAVLGVRACDLAALLIHDQHFIHGDFRDPYYLARRKELFLIAVHCHQAADTCFCASTGDGPRASYGFDIGLSELDAGFILEAHTEQGQAIIDGLNTTEASKAQIRKADAAIDKAAQQQRVIPKQSLPEKLLQNLDHPHWETIAERCLACGNCTAVCPTCFCQNTVEEVSVSGNRTTHYREWETCFSQQHSYIHGITIRTERRDLYRQWLTHKFGTWVEQYGRSGCVGCGRCITWCPVGIDVTEELHTLCGNEEKHAKVSTHE